MYLKLDESKWYKHRYEWSDRSKGIGRVDVYEGQIEVAEDVAPVVHAHWCVTDAYPHNVYCSKCLIIFAQTHWPVWEDKSLPRTYCPSCGARMDEEV